MGVVADGKLKACYTIHWNRKAAIVHSLTGLKYSNSHIVLT